MATILAPPTTSDQHLRMTYEEFLAWADDETRAEWVLGEVIVFMQPNRRHILIVHFLLELISSFVRLRALGQVFGEPFLFPTKDGQAWRRPDISVLLRAHLDRFTSAGMEGVPDVVIEVISSDSFARDRRDKWAEYAAAGVPEYWVVEGRDGRNGITFFALQADGLYGEVPPDANGRLHSRVLPGFWLDPVWLTDDPLPNIDLVLDEIAPGIHTERVERVRQARAGRQTDLAAGDRPGR